LVGAAADAVSSALARRHDAARPAGSSERRRVDADPEDVDEHKL
jgi:hypothetical protein